MHVENCSKYPKGTYRVLYNNRDDSVAFTLKNLCTGEQYRPNTIWDLINSIECDLAKNKFPQETTKYRSWGVVSTAKIAPDEKPAGITESTAGRLEKHITNATFIIKVLFRQNATWQGSIQWIEGKQIREYRSVNELLKLMNDAIQYS